MKRMFTSILCLMLLLSLALPLQASASSGGWYTIQSTEPDGYCYLYSVASDRDELSRNLGKYYNGDRVYVLSYYGGQDGPHNFCRVQTQDDKVGYMHDDALTRYTGVTYTEASEGWYMVQSEKPKGYCYLYSAASDRTGKSRNLGRYNNGELVYVIAYNGGQDGKYNYCQVQTQDGKTGYMHDYALTRYYSRVYTEASEGWYMVQSETPKGYCYLYTAASDRTEKSRNQGRYDNGELVYVMDYYGGQDGQFNYCHVQTQDGKTGYMHDYSLTRYYNPVYTEAGEGWYVVSSVSPSGYAYLYSAASDRDEKSVNLGRYDNGEWIYVMDYDGGQDGQYNYCHVRTQDGKTGYMHDYALIRYQTWYGLDN